jgi:CheY-like chemotaxis protein
MTSAKGRLRVQNIMDLLNILVVDDEPNIRRTLKIFLEAEGHGCE